MVEIRNDVVRKYNIPGCPNLPVKANTMHFRANSRYHEFKIFIQAWIRYKELKHDVLTQAQSKLDGTIVDVVDATTGEEVEIDVKHGNIEELKKKNRQVLFVSKEEEQLIDRLLEINRDDIPFR